MHDVLNKLLLDLIPVLGAAALSLLTIALEYGRRYLKAKLGIELSDALRSELCIAARDAVSFTEEYAHKVIKKQGLELPFQDKEDLAIRTLRDLAKKHNLTEERARQLILIALQEQRSWRS